MTEGAGSPDSVLEAMVQAIGEDLTVKMLMTFGGLRLRLPKEPDPDHILSIRLGHGPAVTLCERFSGEHIEVPTMARWRHETSRRRIVEMKGEGLSTGQIASRLGMTQRGVQTALKRKATAALGVDRDVVAGMIDGPCNGD